VTNEIEHYASLLAESDSLIQVKKFDAAIARAGQAASMQPDDPRAFCLWSRALIGQDNYFDAAQKAQEAIRLDPNSAAGFRLKSLALMKQARRGPRGERTTLGQQSVEASREVVRLAPYDPNGYVGLAQALPLIGAFDEASAAAQEAIRLAPNSSAVWVAASLVALEAKNWDACITACRQALALDPNNYAALNNLGVALRASGKKRQGADALAQAVRVAPDSTTARRNLSSSGLYFARIVILIVLIPIGLIAHVGLSLYLIFAIGSNILIWKYPKVVLQLERWAAPIALRVAKAPREPSRIKNVGNSEDRSFDLDATQMSDQMWSSHNRHARFRNLILLMVAVTAWLLAAIFLFAVFMPSQSDKGSLGTTSAVFFAVAVVLTMAIIRRNRQKVKGR
jgi:tetratricopeptide (TPR) repeat protein